MVYCWKCGVENEDEAATCVSCGASLRPPPRRAARRQYEGDLCFRPGRGIHLIGIFFGILLVLAGLVSILEGLVWWASWERLWPYVVIIFGLIVIAGTLYRR